MEEIHVSTLNYAGDEGVANGATAVGAVGSISMGSSPDGIAAGEAKGCGNVDCGGGAESPDLLTSRAYSRSEGSAEEETRVTGVVEEVEVVVVAVVVLLLWLSSERNA